MSDQLRLDDVVWALERLQTPDSSLIVIGGQALNYWCDRYQANSPELNQYGPFASKDLDFQGSQDLARWSSEQLDGEYSPGFGSKGTRLNGVVRVFDENRELRLQVDFLQSPYGLNADETIKFSAKVEFSGKLDTHTPTKAIGARVMHPLHCLESRLHNVLGLPDQYDNDHGLRQLKAAIVCLRSFIEDISTLDQKRAHALNERVFKFALHGLNAVRIFKGRGIDVFEAASNADTLSENFRTIRYPQMVAELAKRRGS